MGFFDLDVPDGSGENPCYSDNPFDYVWHLNHANHSPEHQFLMGDPPYKLDQKTDVWKLGALIWELMTHDRDEDKPLREDGVVERKDSEADETYETQDGKIGVTDDRRQDRLSSRSMFPTPWRYYPMAGDYSSQLRKLVRGCLNYKSQDRWELKELAHEIDQFISDNTDMMQDTAEDLRIEKDNFETGRQFKRRRRK